MNLDDKKFLAEWMGWEVGEPPHSNVFIWKNKNNLDNITIKEWEPDTNHEQFKEVLEHLTPMQVIELNQKLLNGLTYQQPKGKPFIQYFLAVSNSMLDIIQAGIEVIKEQA